MKVRNIPILDPLRYAQNISIGSLEWEGFVFDKAGKFHINRLEDYLRLSGGTEFPIPPHRKNMHDFMLVTDGVVFRNKELEEYKIRKGNLFFLPAYQVTSMRWMTPKVKGYFCQFHPDIFKGYFLSEHVLKEFSMFRFESNPLVRMPLGKRNLVVALIETLLEEYKNRGADDLQFICVLLLSLFNVLDQGESKPLQNMDPAAFKVAERFKVLLVTGIAKGYTLKQYAEKLDITTDYLNRCMKASMGMTAKQYFDHRVVLEAKVLLKQTDKSISSIAESLGRESVSDFVRFFRSKAGVTPLGYRKKV